MARSIERCRLCGIAELRPVINLGSQALSGLFPRPTPLELVRCASNDGCGLVQLRHAGLVPDSYKFGLRDGFVQAVVVGRRK